MPLAIGVRGLVGLLDRPGRAEELNGNASDDAGGSTDRAVGRSLTSAALVTLAAGGDNLAVYIPLFRQGGASKLSAIALVFVAGEIVVTAAVLAAGRHPRARAVMARLGAVAVPLLLCAVGVLVLWRRGPCPGCERPWHERRGGLLVGGMIDCPKSVKGGPMEDLQGKVAVITGGASGIGKAVATRAAAEGMKIVLADIEENPLKEATDELGSNGADVIGAVTDVSDLASVPNATRPRPRPLRRGAPRAQQRRRRAGRPHLGGAPRRTGAGSSA